jgi:PAS domain S-box-containing protein
MTWQGEAIGTLVAAFEARELLELTASYQGLGDSGETLVLSRGEDGVVRTLHPTRTGSGAPGVVVPSGPGTLGARALEPAVMPPSDDLIDYREERVWAATRYLPEPGLGLAVKIDASEEELTYTEFTAWLRQTALILSAFAILAGFVLGLRFAIPIHALAEVANQIRGGDMHARATVMAEDEVGQLTRTFNEMADELEERVTLLREFRKFFDVSIDLMCIAGTDGYFKRTNPAFERVLGWSGEDLLARPYYDFVHPGDVAATEKEVAKLAQGIPTISFENRFLCKDGSYTRLRWTSYPESGVLYAIAHVIGDATSE